MAKIIKPKEKEMPSHGTQKIFDIIRNIENSQNPVETSLAFSTNEMIKELQNHEVQVELARAKVLMQSRCLTRLL